MQIYVFKTNFSHKTHLREPSPEPRRKPDGKIFERISTAIRGRKKPFANRIRESSAVFREIIAVFCDLLWSALIDLTFFLQSFAIFCERDLKRKGDLKPDDGRKHISIDLQLNDR